jgi:branched-chain amino acid transport system ATP-binding protein/urea transport system ATP-binding protein
LTSVAHSAVGSLSHGERQWVEIGVVMAQNPVLLLLDEPTAGMAEDEVRRTTELLRGINETTTLIVVEHDIGIVTVFHQGRVLIEDTMANVLADPTVREIYLGSTDTRG